MRTQKTNYSGHQNSDSPVIMYFIGFVMLILLSFTILSFMNDENSSLYINLDKKIVDANVVIKEEVNVNKKKDIIDKALERLDDDIKYDKYQATYEKYRIEQLKKRQQEFEQRQRLYQRLAAQERRERLKKLEHQKYQMMQDTVKRPQTEAMRTQIAAQEYNSPQITENKIIEKAMQNSPCSPNSVTAIAYFFHPQNSEPIELIFNNPNPNFDNRGNVKLVFGDISRAKQHILKRNMVNLNAILNRPQYTSDSTAMQTRRSDISMKVMSGVTTSCSPYVYQSQDFYLLSSPPQIQTVQSVESYCKSQNARLADPIELIPVLLSGKYPKGLYWTSGKVLNISSDRTIVNRSNMIPTYAYMLIDYANYSIGFVSQNDYGSDLSAYAVCVIDE